MVSEMSPRNHVLGERVHCRHQANTVERLCAVDGGNGSVTRVADTGNLVNISLGNYAVYLQCFRFRTC